MNRRLLFNNIKSDRFGTVATLIFMATSVMLLCLSILLFVRLYDSIDRLMETAVAPDFLQMHTGAIDEKELSEFAHQRGDVKAMQVLGFLNLQNSQLSIGGVTLSENTQDNGLCSQSIEFDFLIDADNNIIRPSKGEVYAPVCYREEYGLKEGDIMRIGPKELEIAGFLRDSQMNSMMASSKRFLVCKEDYERLRSLGNEEYLIEFKLNEGSNLNAFATAYKEAGLPGNGPTITWPLIRMMNAISDGMMILVILLVSAVILFISVLCITTLILTQLEKDKREIGMLKAVGISRKGIRSIYFSKYLLLSLAGCSFGIILAAILAKPLGERMRELYGNSQNTVLITMAALFGAVLAEGIILFSVSRTLSRIERLSAVEALYGQAGFGKRKNLWVPIGMITVGAVFIIILPWNIKSTIEAPEFAAYMGIGESRIRIDIRQTDHIEESARSVTEALSQDGRVKDFVLMQTGSYQVCMSDGSVYDLMIENGDHSKFPVKYMAGDYPRDVNEIAVSILNAQELNVRIGDALIVNIEDEEGYKKPINCRICGIYSDITNGGKTAKACLDGLDDRTPVMWSIVYLSLKEGVESETDWIREYKERYLASDDGIRFTLISDYLMGTYGQTIRNISNASAVSCVLACMILFVVILLLVRLVIWKERSDSSLKKALGFSSGDIKAEYIKKTLGGVLVGLAVGIFAAIVPGQAMAGLLLKTMGAYGFRFIISPAYVFVVAPFLTVATASASAFISLKEVERIRAFECLGAGRGNY